MRRSHILGLGTVCLVALAGGAAQARDPLPPMPPASSFSAHVDNPWFPLVPGTRFVYVGVRDGEPTRDVVSVRHATATIAGVPCAVVDDRLYARGRLRERTTDWYSQDAGGTVWYLGEETAELDRAGHVTSTEGTWATGRDGARAGIYMPARPRLGQSYRQELYAGHAEDHFRVVSLYPRGRASVLLTEEWTPLEPGTLDHKLYVKGVGTVLEHTERGGDEHAELVSLTRPS